MSVDSMLEFIVYIESNITGHFCYAVMERGVARLAIVPNRRVAGN